MKLRRLTVKWSENSKMNSIKPRYKTLALAKIFLI